MLRAVLGASRAPRVAALTLAAVLAGCGQKGPLFLPAMQGPAATVPARAPSATEDRVPPAPQVQPMPADQPAQAPTGVKANPQ